MVFSLSEIQKTKFHETSGHKYDGQSIKGRFKTKYPFNDKEWKYSPWSFDFIFNQENGFLICELNHRMTNNRVFGWDQDGKSLSENIKSKIYPSYG